MACIALIPALALPTSGCTAEGEGVHVALIDTGVAVELEVFDTYTIHQSTHDPSADHGTMILSTLLGIADPTADALPAERVTVLSYDVGVEPTVQSIAAAINEAVDDQADVISISLGVRRSTAALEAAVERASERGILIIAAAGNVRFLTPDYPAKFEDVVAVAALETEDTFWAESAITRVDTAALGVDRPVLGADGSTRYRSGTSIAAAVVSRDAIAALLAGEIATPADFVPRPPP